MRDLNRKALERSAELLGRLLHEHARDIGDAAWEVRAEPGTGSVEEQLLSAERAIQIWLLPAACRTYDIISNKPNRRRISTGSARRVAKDAAKGLFS